MRNGWIIVDTVSDILMDISEQELEHMLSPDRLERYRRYKHADKKQECAAAGILLHQLKHRVAKGREMPKILSDDLGKLRFTDPELPQFNLTHSGGYAALAVCDDPVGVDMEAIPEEISPERLERLALRFFTSTERTIMTESVKQCRKTEFIRNFYLIWTAKEALVKANGCGLRISPERIESGITAQNCAEYTSEHCAEKEASDGVVWVTRFDGCPADGIQKIADYQTIFEHETYHVQSFTNEKGDWILTAAYRFGGPVPQLNPRVN